MFLKLIVYLLSVLPAFEGVEVIKHDLNTCSYGEACSDDYSGVKHFEDEEFEEVTERYTVGSIPNVATIEPKSQDMDTTSDTGEVQFEFPALHRIDPGNLGDVVELELDPGRFYKRITRAVNPPVFTLPNFFSDAECDHMIKSAINAGLNASKTFGYQSEEGKKIQDLFRVSDQAWLTAANLGDEFLLNIQKRIARLIELPLGVVQRGEPIQVVNYGPGGHYHAHVDSQDDPQPCCFQTRCGDKELTPRWMECCRLCRFLTVMIYLQDVEEGGETAFPLADIPEEEYQTQLKGKLKWTNLSYNCYNASLVVSPKRGTAVFWYTHFLDPETHYLGKLDLRTYHGGCDIIKGRKWISNFWIPATPYEDRMKPSVFYP